MTAPPSVGFSLLTTDRIVELHADAIAHYGGAAGVLHPDRLDGAVYSAVNADLYRTGAETEAEADPLGVAAHLLIYFALNHVFCDGNKRIAWFAMTDQLRLVGLTVDAPTDDKERLVLSVISEKLQAEKVILWLIEHLDAPP
ncbi:type II toxin-antitoxin system death-on-curing family toxin [Chondromyces apiculatus]|uniref:Fido domain-containing protein n=1 Tax=Chondromyces apiculatus DSM 436 TaxID=1192034 RepID=A0A017T2K5_9BACT|nr:Fic family protein [Chondromyces apiculatus]EYF03227.1 Hypothetical protein CAP_5731 [Chondromyces apiculatus DSM 436]